MAVNWGLALSGLAASPALVSCCRALGALLCPDVGRVRRPAAGCSVLGVPLRGTGEFRLSFVLLLGVPLCPAAGHLGDLVIGALFGYTSFVVLHGVGGLVCCAG